METQIFDIMPENTPYVLKYPNGDMVWQHNGLFHREDGPAITLSLGYSYMKWYLFNTEFTEEEFLKRVYHD